MNESKDRTGNEVAGPESESAVRTEAVTESEAHLRLVLETAGLGVWEWNVVDDVVHVSERLLPALGLREGAAFPNYETALASVCDEDRERCDQAVKRALAGEGSFALEFRVVWPDGSLQWISSTALVFRDASGSAVRMIGVTNDITERKQSERTRAELLARIVAAQEDERRRVSRELHDEMGQSLAALIVGLESLKGQLGDEQPARERIRELQDLANRLSQDVHLMAWELRPPALDDLGLEAALRRYVTQWSRRTNVAADWHAQGIDTRRLPSQIETTIYRVVQEALTNVIKHAAASRVSVIVNASGESVSAIVEDDGKGFDAEATAQAAKSHRKLGLVGIRERVWLVGGAASIESAPGRGTTVYARIPLAQDG